MDVDDTELPGAEAERKLEELAIAGDPKAAKFAGVVKLWKMRKERGDSFSQEHVTESMKHIAYYLGYQWLDTCTGPEAVSSGYRICEHFEPVDWTLQIVVNLYKKYINAIRARLLVDKPVPVAVAANDEDEARKQAQVCDQWLKYYNGKWEAERKWQRLAAHVVATGLGWIYDRYDPDAWADVEVEGKPVRKRVGNAVTELGTAWDVRWEPGTTVQDSPWYIRSQKMTLKEVREKWPERGRFVKGTEGGDGNPLGLSEGAGSLSGSLLRHLGGGSKDYGSSAGEDEEPGGKWVTVSEGFERVSSKSDETEDRWKVMPWCEDIQLEDEGSVAWQPLTPVPFDEIEGWPFPVGAGRDLSVLQDRLNIQVSRITEHGNLNTHPKVLVHVSTGVQEGVFSSQPGEQVEWSGDVPPEYMVPPPLHPEVYGWVDRLIAFMDDLSGAHEVSQGKSPSSSTSGRAIALLQEQDSTNIGNAVSNFKSALTRHYKNLVSIAQANFTEDRWVGVVGEDDRADVKSMAADGIKLVKDVRLKVGSAIPLLPGARREMVFNLLERGLYDPSMRDVREAVLRDLEWGGGQPSATLEQNARKQAQREHSLLEANEPILPPHPHELSDAHLIEHRLYATSSAYRLLDKDQKLIFDEHYEATRVFGVAQAAAATQEEMLAQGGGLAPGPEAIPQQEGI